MSEMDLFKPFVLLCLCLGFSYADRTVTTSFHSFDIENSTVTVGYVEAKGSGDSLHYLYSTEGVPAVLVVRTKPTAVIKVEAQKISFVPSSDVLFTYGVAFSRIIEYNDSKDDGDMGKYDSNNNMTWNSYGFDTFAWENMTAQSDAKSNMIMMNVSHSYLNEALGTNGSITLRFRAYANSGREDELPHLQYNENVTQFDLSIDHIMSNLSKARFAVEVMMLGQEKNTPMWPDTSKSIDDEYTPGVFLIYNWLNNQASSTNAGFLQWKPVCYQSMSRARRVATGMKHYGLRTLTANQDNQLDSSILKWYYGDNIVGLSRTAMNFSFGMSQDGGYNKSEVMSWTASIGYGTPPEDTVSTVVIIIIIAGLGIPVILLILGGIYVCVKKRNSKDPKPLQNIQNGYQPLPNDD